MTADLPGEKTLFRRLLHWGPGVALGIIFTIYTMSIVCLFQWWPPLSSACAFVHFVIFTLDLYNVVSNLIAAAHYGPGFVPLGWRPETVEDESKLQYCHICNGFKVPRSHHCRKCGRCVMKMDHHCPWINNCSGHFNHLYFIKFLFAAVWGCGHSMVIVTCRCVMKMDHHCPWINNCSGHFNHLYFIKFLFAAVWGCGHSMVIVTCRCVMKMDHHCPWINNCSGHFNHLYFIKFLFAAVWGCGHSMVILTCSVYRALFRVWYMYYGDGTEPVVELTVTQVILSIFADGLAVGVVCSVGFLFFINLRIVYRNRSGIEDWILAKAEYRRRKEEEEEELGPFVYPYNLGWRENARLTFTWSGVPQGDGIWWPVVEGCDQFTLTLEQLAQKANKETHLVEYEAVSEYSGSWFPCLSYGVKAACCIPISDEPRILLRPGDLILVSRWKRHWLYGELLKDGRTRDFGEARARGWFPRRAVVRAMKSDPNSQSDREKSSASKKSD